MWEGLTCLEWNQSRFLSWIRGFFEHLSPSNNDFLTNLVINLFIGTEVKPFTEITEITDIVKETSPNVIQKKTLITTSESTPCPPSDIIKHIELYKLFQVSSFPEMSENFQVSDLQNRKKKAIRFYGLRRFMNESHWTSNYATFWNANWASLIETHPQKQHCTNQMLVNRINAAGIFQTMVWKTNRVVTQKFELDKSSFLFLPLPLTKLLMVQKSG